MIPQAAVEIEVDTRGVTGRDEAGDDVYGVTTRTLKVYGVAPSSSDEPEERNRSAVVTAWDIYAPPGTRIGPQDTIRLPGVDGNCEVIGEPALWEHNPYGSPMGNFGVVLKVRKVSG